MADLFRAFSFVDRITLLEPGRRVLGGYAVPAGLERFPLSLAAEAVGQLAAWAAMAAVGFTHRPLAGIAGRVEMLAPVDPGQRLDLAAELESVDSDSVVYSGWGEIDGVPVVRLVDCVGPMVPLEEYADPTTVRGRFDLITGPGAVPGVFGGVPDVPLQRTGGEAGSRAVAELEVPRAAPLFGDHFPRRPLFPGTLLMHLNLELARALAAEVSTEGGGGAWAVRAIAGVKLRAFMAPGDQLQLEASAADRSADGLICHVTTRKGQRVISSAQVEFGREGGG